MTYVVWANQRIHRPHAGGRKPAGVRPVMGGVRRNIARN